MKTLIKFCIKSILIFFTFSFFFFVSIEKVDSTEKQTNNKQALNQELKMKFNQKSDSLNIQKVDNTLVSEPKEMDVVIVHTDNGFLPKNVFIKKDTKVKLHLVNAMRRELAFVSDDFEITKGVSTDKINVIEFQPTQIGKYKFYCPISENIGWFNIYH